MYCPPEATPVSHHHDAQNTLEAHTLHLKDYGTDFIYLCSKLNDCSFAGKNVYI